MIHYVTTQSGSIYRVDDVARTCEHIVGKGTERTSGGRTFYSVAIEVGKAMVLLWDKTESDPMEVPGTITSKVTAIRSVEST
jgi:hypothetical protein